MNSKMREAERRWPAGKKESRDGFFLRLKRTAMRLTPDEIDDALVSMKRRCEDLKEARGGQIEG